MIEHDMDFISRMCDPVIVMGEDYRVPATSVPYWSDDCGEKFEDVIELEYAFDRFYSNLDRYASRKVYESEFSYAVSVKKLLDIFEK